MKKIKNTKLFAICQVILSLLLIICGIVLLFNTLILALQFDGVPYKWTLGGKTVYDQTVDGGAYYQVNDTLKIMFDENKNFSNYQLYELNTNDNEWKKLPDIFMFSKLINEKIKLIKYLRLKYNEHIKEIKKNQIKINNSNLFNKNI